MDVAVEISIETLFRLLAERLSKERIVFDAQAPVGGETLVFDHASLAGLALTATPQTTTIMVPTAAGSDQSISITGQRVRATMTLALNFASMRGLAALAPGGRPTTIPLRVPVHLDLGISLSGSSIQLTLASPSADLSGLPIDDPAYRMRLQMQADAALAALVRTVSSSVDLSPLGALTGGTLDVANAGLAVDGLTGPATFLKLGIQLRGTATTVTAPILAAGTITDWSAFFATPTSIRGSADWAVAVDGGIVARGSAGRLESGLAGSDRLTLRGSVTGRWLSADGSHPTPRVRIDAPVQVLNACGTGHSLDAEVHVDGTFSVPGSNLIEMDAHVSHDVDFLSQLGCEFEIAFIGAGAGFVIGGAFGGWIGALVGAIVGFVVGFVATAIAVAVINPAVPAVPGCTRGVTDQDLVCQQSFAVGGSDLFAGLSADGTASSGTALVLTGHAVIPPSPLAMTAAYVVDRWTWQRLPDGSGHAATTAVEVTNLGGHTVLFGPASWQNGTGHVWEPYLAPVPTAPLLSGQRATLRLVVPKTIVDAARTDGALRPPQLLIFTTGGARLATWTTVPEDISEEALGQADALQALLGRLRAAEYATRGVIFRPFPPDPHTNVIDSALLLGVFPASGGETVPTVLDAKGNIVALAVGDAGSMAALRAVVTGTTADQLIVAAMPKDLSGAELASVVEQRLQAARDSAADWAKVESALASAVADEKTLAPVALPSGTLIDAARADVGALTKLVDELTGIYTGEAGKSARFGIVALSTVYEMQPEGAAAVSASKLGPLSVDVISDGQNRTLSLAGVLPFQVAATGIVNQDVSGDAELVVGSRFVAAGERGQALDAARPRSRQPSGVCVLKDSYLPWA